MKKLPIEVGCFVRSIAGRDAGRLFIVVEEQDVDFVTIVNGKLRTVDRPKRKRRKHLKPTGERCSEYLQSIREGAAVEDHEVRSWLKKEEERLVQV